MYDIYTMDVTNIRVHDVVGGTVNDTAAAPLPFAYRDQPLNKDQTDEPSNATHSTLYHYHIISHTFMHQWDTHIEWW